MIQNLSIRNFKSIRELDIPCRKLNIFIGEPNSGKSNIIEALALQSQNTLENTYLNKAMFRYRGLGDLFNDNNHTLKIEVITDNGHTILEYPIMENGGVLNRFHYYHNTRQEKESPIEFDSVGKSLQGYMGKLFTTQVLLYEFKRIEQFVADYQPNLNVPHGSNVPNILRVNNELRQWVNDLFKSLGYRLIMKNVDNDISMAKDVDDQLYEYPYFTISETLQRIIFYSLAIRSNISKTLLFDEPETNTFPFYTKFIAECIALDESNQFFITTHNPYMLLSLIEKSKASDLNVCIARMEHFETKVHVLNEDQISSVLDFNSDVFFNFERVLEI